MSLWAGARQDEHAAGHGEAGVSLRWRPGDVQATRRGAARNLLGGSFSAMPAALLTRESLATNSPPGDLSATTLYSDSARNHAIRGVRFIGGAAGATDEDTLGDNFSLITFDIGTPGAAGTPGTSIPAGFGKGRGGANVNAADNTGRRFLDRNTVYVVTSNQAQLGRVFLRPGAQLIGIGGYLPVYATDSSVPYLWRAGAFTATSANDPRAGVPGKSATAFSSSTAAADVLRPRLTATKISMRDGSGIHHLELYSNHDPDAKKGQRYYSRHRGAFIHVNLRYLSTATVQLRHLNIRATNFPNAIISRLRNTINIYAHNLDFGSGGTADFVRDSYLTSNNGINVYNGEYSDPDPEVRATQATDGFSRCMICTEGS